MHAYSWIIYFKCFGEKFTFTLKFRWRAYLCMCNMYLYWLHNELLPREPPIHWSSQPKLLLFKCVGLGASRKASALGEISVVASFFHSKFEFSNISWSKIMNVSNFRAYFSFIYMLTVQFQQINHIMVVWSKYTVYVRFFLMV